MKTYCTLVLFALAFSASAQKQGQPLIDSLVPQLQKVKNDSNKVKMYVKIIAAYYRISPATGLKYGETALALANKLEYENGDLYVNLGVMYDETSNFTRAAEFYNKAIAFYSKRNKPAKLANAYLNLGSLNETMSNYTEAVQLNLNALKIYESVKDSGGIALVYQNMGNDFSYLKNYNEGLKYYRSALSLYEQLKDTIGIGNVLNNIGGLYLNIKKLNEALDVHTRALKIARDFGYTKGIVNSLNNLSNIYTTLHDYSKGLELGYQCADSCYATLDSEALANVLGNIGTIYLFIAKDSANKSASKKFIPSSRKEALGLAIKNLEESIRISRNRNLYTVQGSLLNLADAEHLLGNDRKAYDCLDRYNTIRDTIYSKENTRKVAQLQDKYEFDKKEASIKAENDKQRAIDAETYQSKLKLWTLAGVFIVAFTILSFYFFRKREKYQFNLRLVAIRQQALNAQMSDHFIGNSMDSINLFIKNNDKEKASEYLILFSRLVKKVLENATEKVIPLADDLDILKNYLTLEIVRFPPGALRYEISIDEQIDVHNLLIPPMVFQVLTENAIRHGFKKTNGGTILLKIRRLGDLVECLVQDDGVGLKAAKREKETLADSRTAHGGSLAEKLVQTANSDKRCTYSIVDLSDENNNQHGTRVIFTLPYLLAD